MPAFDLKKLTPHLWIIGLLAVVAFIYNYPALQGMELNQHDHLSWKAMSKEAMDYYERTGKNPLWSNSMFGGMPTYTTYYAEDNNVMRPVLSLIQSIFVKPAYFFFLAMLCFYLMMVSLRCNRWLAALGAFAYAFASYNAQIIAAGHETKMLAMAFMPGVLAGFMMVMRGRYLGGAALFALMLTFLFASNHFQIIYYTGLMLIGVWITYVVILLKAGKQKQLMIGTACAIGAAIIGLAPSATAILSTKEYDRYSMRSGQSELTNNNKTNKGSGGLDKDYAFRWSNGVGEVLTIMVPNLYGGGSREDIGTSSNYYEKLTSIGVPEANAEQMAANAPTYFGDQPFVSGPVYFGAIICFLFVLGMILLKSPHKWWVAVVSVLAILMSMGKNFAGLNYLLFDTLPLLNKFRTPSMILILPQLLFAATAVWVLDQIVERKYQQADILKAVKRSAIITAGLSLLLGVLGQMFFDFKAAGDDQLLQQFTQSGANAQIGQEVISALRDDRASMAMMSGLRSAVFILLAAALIHFYNKGTFAAKQLLIGLFILVVFDLIPIAHKYLNEDFYVDSDELEMVFQPSAADQQILQDKDPFFRVLDVSRDTYNDAIPAVHHHLIGGYHPAKMEIYQDLINNHMNQSTGNFNGAVLNMLNTKYFIFPGGNGQAIAQQNPGALGNAWFVKEIKWVTSADEEMASLNAPKIGDTTQASVSFNPAQTAVVRNEFKDVLNNWQPAKDSAARIQLTQYDLMEMKYRSNNSGDGLAVFSDIWYPAGWNAYIDGKPAEIIRANYVLRALKVPAGDHEIVFKFEPQSFAMGMNIAMTGSILLVILCVVALVFWWKRHEKRNTLTGNPVPSSASNEAIVTPQQTRKKTRK